MSCQHLGGAIFQALAGLQVEPHLGHGRCEGQAPSQGSEGDEQKPAPGSVVTQLQRQVQSVVLQIRAETVGRQLVVAQGFAHLTQVAAQIIGQASQGAVQTPMLTARLGEEERTYPKEVFLLLGIVDCLNIDRQSNLHEAVSASSRRRRCWSMTSASTPSSRWPDQWKRASSRASSIFSCEML